MKLYATIAAIALAVSAFGQFRNYIPENPTSAISSQYLHDVFWVAGTGYDWKISYGTLTLTTRPEFFNIKWAGTTEAADWEMERRWTIKAIKADGTSEVKIIKTWDDTLEYTWPAGTLYVGIGYTIYPHHKTGDFHTNPQNGCAMGINVQPFGGGHQPINPFTINYR